MKGLLVKDMLFIRQSWPVFAYPLYLTLMCAIMTGASGKFYPAVGPAIAATFCLLPLMVIADDHRTGYEKTLAFTPISKEKMIGARYLLNLIVSLAGCLMVSLILGIGAMIGSVPMSGLLTTAIMFMVTALVIPSASLPLIYFFKRANTVMGFSMMILCAITALAFIFRDKIDFSVGTAAVMFAATLVMMAVSYMISVRIFRKTEIC
ncbi:MAG: ABC-2 transporter permease [Ruminococcus sp.]|uniref:ABC-2 transporter permease n=1 Tax=Ruminococcus sp. TaxID=41978 RepID=UPI0025FB112D|nr:ABC-2 transporter permease [Ruminococcus sp.]MBO4867087.1 ABC-2 transporter permease [Ruminococcus sp.]